MYSFRNIHCYNFYLGFGVGLVAKCFWRTVGPVGVARRLGLVAGAGAPSGYSVRRIGGACIWLEVGDRRFTIRLFIIKLTGYTL